MGERIPDDVMEAAREAVEAMPARAPFKSDVEIAIARAIMAERERCAKIAETRAEFFRQMTKYVDGPIARISAASADVIAKSIRGES